MSAPTEQAPPPGSAGPDGRRWRRWATEAWYYGRLWALGLTALAIVCFMASAIILVNWPHLAGPQVGPRLERHHPLPPPDWKVQRDRWGRLGPEAPMNPVGPEERVRRAPSGAPTAP